MAQGSGVAVAETRGRLTHISKVLGLPVAAFYGASSPPADPHAAEDRAETDVILRVTAHLRDRDPAARRRFAGLLSQLLEAECR